MRAPHLPAHCSVGGQEKEVGHSHLSELSASSNHLFRLPSALHRLPSALHRLPSAQAGIAQVTISAQVAICIALSAIVVLRGMVDALKMKLGNRNSRTAKTGQKRSGKSNGGIAK